VHANPKEATASFLVPIYLQLLHNIMEGKAARSASGAAMSKYDVEVEARLKAIEAEIASIKEGLKNHSHTSGGGDTQAQLDDLIKRLGRKMSF